jgi:hypothetical protein
VLGDGVTFDRTTFGLKIASTIAEYAPHTRIGRGHDLWNISLKFACES